MSVYIRSNPWITMFMYSPYGLTLWAEHEDWIKLIQGIIGHIQSQRTLYARQNARSSISG